MRGKNRVTIGFIAMMVATGIVDASGSFASGAGHVTGAERIGHGGSTYQVLVGPVSACQMKADVIERIGVGGATYLSGQASECQIAGKERNSVNSIERVGAGGSTYSARQPKS